jgi:cytochrome P450
MSVAHLDGVAVPQAPERRPAPRGHWLLGELPAIRRDPLSYFTRLAAEPEDVVEVSLGLQRIAFANSPAAIQHVLQDNAANYRKSRFYEILRPMLGNGLVTSNGAEWQRQRRMSQPAFNASHIVRLVGMMAETVGDMLRRWESGPPVRDVTVEMMRLSLDTVVRCLFGTKLGDAEIDAVYHALTVILGRAERRVWALTGLSALIPSGEAFAFRAAVRRLDAIVYGVIAERRQNPKAEGDLLTMVLEETGGEEGPEVDRFIRDQVVTMMVAGHETTANSMAWTWYLLSRHPGEWRRMVEEVDGVLGTRAPTYEDVPRLAYTKQVLQESLRLYPPIWTISREAIAADRIAGHEVPAGRTVMVCPFANHRSPKIWSNPEGFDPDRWAPERAKGYHKYAWFPFAGGPRSCIGARFGFIETQVMLAMVAQRFALELVPGQVVTPEPMITMRPRHGLWMTLRRR